MAKTQSLAELYNIKGWFGKVHGRVYNEIASKIFHGRIAEIGVFQGLSLSYILESCRKNQNRVFAIDRWLVNHRFREQKINTKSLEYWQIAWDEGVPIDEEGKVRDFSGVFERNLQKMGFEDIVELLKLPSDEASRKFEDDFFDFVFIDGRHAFEFVKNDIESWYPKVKDGGLIGGHDYTGGWPDVINAVRECFSGRCVIQRDGLWFVRKGYDYSI